MTTINEKTETKQTLQYIDNIDTYVRYTTKTIEIWIHWNQPEPLDGWMDGWTDGRTDD